MLNFFLIVKFQDHEGAYRKYYDNKEEKMNNAGYDFMLKRVIVDI